MIGIYTIVSYGSKSRELPGGLNKVGFDWYRFYNQKNTDFIYLGYNFTWNKNYKELPYFDQHWIIKILSLSIVIFLLNSRLIFFKEAKIFIHYIPTLSVFLFPNKSKIKWFMHGDYTLEYCERGASSLKLFFLRMSKRLLISKFKRFNAYNYELRKELLKKNKDVSGYHNAIDYPLILTESKEKLVISYAYWNSRKNLQRTIEGFIKLNSGNNYRLLLLGGISDEYKSSFHSILKKYEGQNIEYKGYVKRDILIKYLTKAQIFMLLSEAEGFPLSFLEAFAYRCVVISSVIVAKSWGSSKICTTPQSISNFGDIEVDEIDWLKELIQISPKKIQDLW